MPLRALLHALSRVPCLLAEADHSQNLLDDRHDEWGNNNANDEVDHVVDCKDAKHRNLLRCCGRPAEYLRRANDSHTAALVCGTLTSSGMVFHWRKIYEY